MTYGDTLGEILRHAAAKEAEISDMSRRLPSVAIDTLGDFVKTFRHEQVKREHRVATAHFAAQAGLTVRLIDFRTGSVVAEGILKSVKPEDATVKIKDDTGVTKQYTYAEDVPVPRDLARDGQTYYGTRLTLKFEVVDVPAGKEYVLR